MKNTVIKKIIFLSFGLVLFSIVACSNNDLSEEKITMLLTTNVRGQLDPCGWKANPLGGLPRRLTYINQIKQSGVDPILLDAGDALFENDIILKEKLSSAKLRAETVVKSTAKMGNYIYNVGQYDFAGGYSFIKELESTFKANFISSNLFLRETNKLAFNGHEIININGIKVGVFGIITDIPSMVKELELKDPILTAQSKINELRPKVDLLVMLLNASIPQVRNSISNFEGVDYVFTSRETSRTRPETGQEGSGPLHYCMGIQGKYIGRFDITISDKTKPITDITSRLMAMNFYENRLKTLQNKDPKKPIEEIYKNNRSVLDMIEKFKAGAAESESELQGAPNKSFYSLIPLNGGIASERGLLKLVDQVLDTCEELDKKATIKT